MFIVLLAAIESQPRDQVEAARLDGASALPDLPRHHLARDRAGRGHRRADPPDRGLQDRRPAERADQRRPRHRHRIDDAARLHRLARAGPRRLRGDRAICCCSSRRSSACRSSTSCAAPARRPRHERPAADPLARLAVRAAPRSSPSPLGKVAGLCRCSASGPSSCCSRSTGSFITSFKLPIDGRRRPVLPAIRRLPAVPGRLALHLRRSRPRHAAALSQLGDRGAGEHACSRCSSGQHGGLCAGRASTTGRGSATIGLFVLAWSSSIVAVVGFERAPGGRGRRGARPLPAAAVEPSAGASSARSATTTSSSG